VRLKIKDIDWEFEVLPKDQYEKKYGSDSSGITVKHERRVFFRSDDFSLFLVRHELFHVYCASCCITSTDNLDGHDMEEIGAEITEYHAEDIVKFSKKIWEKLKK
jgi:hypothetical protein